MPAISPPRSVAFHPLAATELLPVGRHDAHGDAVSLHLQPCAPAACGCGFIRGVFEVPENRCQLDCGWHV
jgi:hypothetical protein